MMAFAFVGLVACGGDDSNGTTEGGDTGDGGAQTTPNPLVGTWSCGQNYTTFPYEQGSADYVSLTFKSDKTGTVTTIMRSADKTTQVESFDKATFRYEIFDYDQSSKSGWIKVRVTAYNSTETTDPSGYIGMEKEYSFTLKDDGIEMENFLFTSGSAEWFYTNSPTLSKSETTLTPGVYLCMNASSYWRETMSCYQARDTERYNQQMKVLGYIGYSDYAVVVVKQNNLIGELPVFVAKTTPTGDVTVVGQFDGYNLYIDNRLSPNRGLKNWNDFKGNNWNYTNGQLVRNIGGTSFSYSKIK